MLNRRMTDSRSVRSGSSAVGNRQSQMAQDHILQCECGHEQRVRPQQAGSSIACVSCGQPQLVPQLRELRKLPVAEDTQDTPPTKGWGLGRGICFSTGLGVLMLSLAVAIIFGVRRAQLDERRPPPINPEFNRDLQEMGPLEAWTLWESARDKPIFRQTPQYLVNREFRAKYLRFIWIATACGFVGLITMVIAFVFPTRPPPAR